MRFGTFAAMRVSVFWFSMWSFRFGFSLRTAFLGGGMPHVAATTLRPSKSVGDLRPKFHHPATDGFVRHINAALRQHLLNFTQAQIEASLKSDRVCDDLRWISVAFVAIHPQSIFLWEVELSFPTSD